MRESGYFSKLRELLTSQRTRRKEALSKRQRTKRVSPFRMEQLEARVLLAGDLAGASLQSAVVQTQPQLVAASVTPTPTLFVSTLGSDRNDGRSALTPLRTISQAGLIARAGDVVSIKGGTYSEYATLQNSGTSTSRITFMAAPGERVIVDGANKAPNTNDPWNNPPVIRVRGNYVTVQGIEVANSAGDGVWISGQNVTLDGLNVHNAYMSGVLFFNTWDGVVQNSIIHDVYNWGDPSQPGGDSDGIGLKGTTGGRHTIRNNVIYNSSDDGIDTWQNAGNLIEGNVVHHSGINMGDGDGFKLGPGGNNTVRGNVAYDNRKNGFDSNSGSGNQIYNNTAYHNGAYNFVNYTVPNTLTNNLSASGTVAMNVAVHSYNSWNLGISNPVFSSTDPASAGFLRLGNGSPAIDAGTNVGLSYSGSAPDLGAYEAVGVAPAPPPPQPVIAGTINVARAIHETGNAYWVAQDFGITGDSSQALSASTLRIFENGKELGPAHTPHATIRQLGGGRFSHWGNELYFSASDNTNPLTNGRTYTYAVGTGTASQPPATPSPAYREGTINITQAIHESGNAYWVAQNFGVTGDSSQALTASTLRIFENGMELGPAHTLHATIRQLGGGRFSHWGNELYFSASDNTNPLTNGRTYTYRIYT